MDITDPPEVVTWSGQAPSSWTNDNTVLVSWTTPVDATSGLDGYDYSWTTPAAADPGSTRIEI